MAPFLRSFSRLKSHKSEFTRETRLLHKHGFVFKPGMQEVQATTSAETRPSLCTHLTTKQQPISHFHRCTHGIVSDPHPFELEVISDVECACCDRTRSRTPVYSERDSLKTLLWNMVNTKLCTDCGELLEVEYDIQNAFCMGDINEACKPHASRHEDELGTPYLEDPRTQLKFIWDAKQSDVFSPTRGGAYEPGKYNMTMEEPCSIPRASFQYNAREGELTLHRARRGGQYDVIPPEHYPDFQALVLPPEKERDDDEHDVHESGVQRWCRQRLDHNFAEGKAIYNALSLRRDLTPCPFSILYYDGHYGSLYIAHYMTKASLSL